MKKLVGCATALTIAAAGLAAVPGSAQPAAAAEVSVEATGPFAMYAPPGGKFGAESKSDRAILGDYNTYVVYSWSVQPGSISTACVDGWVPWGKEPKKGTWISMGCGKSGGGKNILWGSYAAIPKMRAKGVTTGAVIQWSH